MTTTVAGEFKSGKLKLLEKPRGLRDGKVRVTIEDEAEEGLSSTSVNRQAFLRLPLSERRRILKEQADKLATHYGKDGEWREWLAGDIVKY